MKPLEPLQVPAKEVDIVTEKASDPQHPNNGQIEDSDRTLNKATVNKRAYLYGKDVFVPSDIHAVSYRRRTPWYQPVEGQFDDADS
uniref:Uncharacterized protein n=1 Tax=Ixodes ricinus TaxID=34613 RepID=V5I409_IXORI